MIRSALIVDDEPLARRRLEELVRATSPSTEIIEAGNGDAAAEAIAEQRPDMVLLDVQMPGQDGFELIRSVGADRMPPTIFVTAFDKHAIRAFDVAAVDYLLKPFDDDRFHVAWNRLEARIATLEVVAQSRRLAALVTKVRPAFASSAAIAAASAAASAPSAGDAARTATAPPELAGSSSQRRHADRVVVKKDDRTILVKLSEVQWIESNGNYIVLHVGSAEHVLRDTLANFETKLDPRHFVRIHRRTIVAIDAIREVQPWFGGDQVMILLDGRQLRVSRTFRLRVARRMAGED